MQHLIDFNNVFSKKSELLHSLSSEFNEKYHKIKNEYEPKIHQLEREIESLKRSFQKKNQLKDIDKIQFKKFLIEYLSSKPEWITENYSDFKLIEIKDVGYSLNSVICELKFEKYFFSDPYHNSKYCETEMTNIEDDLVGVELGLSFLGRSNALISEKTTNSKKYNKIRLKFNF